MYRLSFLASKKADKVEEKRAREIILQKLKNDKVFEYNNLISCAASYLLTCSEYFFNANFDSKKDSLGSV